MDATVEAIKFLSTPSARRATRSSALNLSEMLFLSTPSARRATVIMDFSTSGRGIFLSTPSARRATVVRISVVHDALFLSTPSARRATLSIWTLYADARDFYPRPPRGGRRAATCLFPPTEYHFYPRPPRGGRRFAEVLGGDKVVDFYPRPPRGGRRIFPHHGAANGLFLSTPSARRATRTIPVFSPGV